MTKKIDRRAFLGVAGAAAASAAATLAGCGSNASAIPSASIPDEWDHEADFVVVGSGTAQVAALKAVTLGMSCIVVEALPAPGGTTSLSGGAVWVPCNDYAEDDPAAAKQYMMRIADGLSTEAIIDAYIAEASNMVNFISQAAGVKWTLVDRTDYHDQWEGATTYTRSLRSYDPKTGEELRGAGFTVPQAEKFSELGGRFLLSTTAEQLIARTLADGRQEVLGLIARDRNGRKITVRANKAVLLGAGGFDYNEDMKAQYLDIPSPCTLMVATCRGGGIRMAQGVGADLALMGYGWGNAGYKVPAEKVYAERRVSVEMSPLCYQGDTSSMWVNRHGRRFCDEAASYDAFWYGFGNGRDTTGDMQYTNIPAWYVCDQGNRDRLGGNIGVGTPNAAGSLWGIPPDADPPPWIIKSDTLEALAQKMGLDELATENLVAQVARFNKYAAQGRDPEFHRGESQFDQGGPGRPADCLEPMDKPPYYAAEIVPFLMGTKGGPRINEHGQVAHVNGRIVPRLYACGNGAGCGGPGKYYTGAGGTVGPGMVFAYIAAMDASRLDAWV